MDHETFLHYMWDHVPNPHSDGLDWYTRLPKKLGRSMTAPGSRGVEWGWGVLIVEGPNMVVISGIAFGVITASLVTGIVYGIVAANAGAGFSIAQWMVAVVGAAVSVLYYSVVEQ